MAAAFPNEHQVERALASRAKIPNAETKVIANARFYLAEDYHQKYYLRHDRVLMAELAAYSPSAFVDSTVAARLNAYVAGHGPLIEDELDAMALSPAALQHVRDQFARRRRSA